jgi:hypothetical protein
VTLSGYFCLANAGVGINNFRERQTFGVGGFLFVGWAHWLPQKESDRDLSTRHKIFRHIRY